MFLQYCVYKKIHFENLKTVHTVLKNYNKIKFKSHVASLI